ncbi:DoxX family protein [Novosphingobium cyanobacteriorum]|uniref:DoxX family protein n=1 Tax=Novosphingobium cyanobacteriorum TaxID=3024215 RepID=A0ABT6CGH6_9SPHN|nr:DoxX family protein [Novosphingobium cyanobacteriorum]MDF8333029.1 DoxX family protein [Novosphingobium cyanobacteriorum]
MNTVAALLGRILLALLFLVSGVNKLFAVNQTESLITGVGLPPNLALAVALFEIVGAIALIFGFMTRLFAILFAGFSLLTVLFFHHDFTDPMQATMALKNLAIAGGMLCLFAHSQMRWSYDSMVIARRGERETRAAEERAREAELRAAKAEGRAEVRHDTVPGTVPARPIPASTMGYVDTNADSVPDRRRRWWELR